MKIILDIATILGGIAALLFFWDKLITSRLPKKSPDELKINRRIERQVAKPVNKRIHATEDQLIRQRIRDSILNPEPDRHVESIWLIFCIPVYCCLGAVIICLVTIYISPFAGLLTSWFISLVSALIGWKIQGDHGDKDDRAFLLLWGSYIIFMASNAGLGTIHDNELDLSDLHVRNIYIAAEAIGSIILGMLAAIIRTVRRNRRK